MKKVIIIILVLTAFVFHGWAQTYTKINANLTLNKEEIINHTLELNPTNNEISEFIQIPISLRWVQTDGKDTVRFILNKKETLKNRYIYVFADDMSFKTVKKAVKVKFDRSFSKKMKLDGHSKTVQRGIKKGKTIMENRMDTEDSYFYYTFDAYQKSLDFELIAYIAIADNKKKKKNKIRYETVIPFHITLDLCQSKVVLDSIASLKAQIEKIDKKNGEMKRKIDYLQNLPCKDNSLRQEEYNKVPEVKSVNNLADCAEYMEKGRDLNIKISDYNKSIDRYNSAFYNLKNCVVAEHTCSCTEVSNLLQKRVGPLLFKLQGKQIDPETARHEFKSIKMPSADKCKRCSDYRTLKESYDQLKKLLNL